MMTAADPSIINSNYVLPPDYEIMTETAEVFTKALLLGMTPETDRNNFAQTAFAEPLPEEFLPYEEAVAYMRKRLPVDKETYYALSDKMRYRAFTVSRLADGDAVRNIQSKLAEAMEKGSGMQQFLQLTENQLADAAGMGRGSGWYYETVYRTNTATAYNVGRAIGFEEIQPIALELIGIDDSRQTEICHSLTVPPFRRPYDDPVWDTLWPPFHFNCRTTIRAIYDQSEIDDAGGPDKFYTKSDPDFTPAEGFGKYPVDKSDSWWDLTDAMKERAQEYGLEAEFMEARERLIEPEYDQPADPLEETALREAENYARNTLGIDYADYTGIDSRVANEWNRHLANNLQEFPELRNILKFTGSTEAQDKLFEPVLNRINLERARRNYPKANEAVIRMMASGYTKRDLEKLNIGIARSVFPTDERLRQFAGIGINPRYGSNISIFERTATVQKAVDHEIAHALDHLLGLRSDAEVVALWNNSPARGSASVAEFIADGWSEYRNNPGKNSLSDQLGYLILRKYRLWKG
jgi:SPP1 gp7 family putative phage head morphogenesis protein